MIPYIKKDEKGIPTLYVHDEPFFATVGELHNSSGSSLAYMNEHVWPQLEGLNVNTVITPVYWELLEPVEGQFNFDEVDGVISEARRHDTHIVFLWFGLWKNAESMYIPSWMKKDSATYFRARKETGEPINTISPVCKAAVEKDARAFRALMAHIREFDENENTVIIMQVENEIGLLGTDRDYSKEAEELYARGIPADLASEAGVAEGTAWEEVYDYDAHEAFMAYHFASAVEEISRAGKEEYPIPFYANAWLKQYPWYAGSYPSGGPVGFAMKIWKTVAPSLFTLAPDIYVPYCAQVMEEYSAEDNPLFIPEIRKDTVTASYALYAFTHYNAICYSPFGIEELALDPDAIDKPPMSVMIALNIDPSAFDIAGSKDYLSEVYGLMTDMRPQYLKYRGTGSMKSWLRTGDLDHGALLRFRNYDLRVSYAPKGKCQPLAAGVIYELDENTFLVAGMMSTLTFVSKPGSRRKAEILCLEEGSLKNGEWIRGRVMNGDEKMSISFRDHLGLFKVTLFEY